MKPERVLDMLEETQDTYVRETGDRCGYMREEGGSHENT